MSPGVWGPSLRVTVSVQPPGAPASVDMRRQDALRLSAPRPPRPALAPRCDDSAGCGLASQNALPWLPVAVGLWSCPRTGAWLCGLGQVSSPPPVAVLVCRAGWGHGLPRGRRPSPSRAVRVPSLRLLICQARAEEASLVLGASLVQEPRAWCCAWRPRPCALR